MAAVVEANGGDLRSAQRVMAAAKRRTPLVRDLRTSTENIRVAASMRHGHPRDDGIPRRRVDRPRASWEEIMKTSARIGIVILGLMSLGNVPSILTTDGEHPPMAIAAVLTFLGIAGLVLTVLAWRGNRSSLIALVALQGVSALSSVPAFTSDGVPAGLQVVAALGIAIIVLGIALVVPVLRGRPTHVAA